MDKRVLAAAADIAAKKLANITILGKPESIETEARRLGLDLSACTIIDHTVRVALLGKVAGTGHMLMTVCI